MNPNWLNDFVTVIAAILFAAALGGFLGGIAWIVLDDIRLRRR